MESNTPSTLSVGQADGRWMEGCSTVRVHLKIQGNERNVTLFNIDLSNNLDSTMSGRLEFFALAWNARESWELQYYLSGLLFNSSIVLNCCHKTFYLPRIVNFNTSLFNATPNGKEGSEARTASSLSLARVRPSAITNGTNKHSSTTGSSSSSTSSSHSKTQRSASTYHRQRRHSDFCESLFWRLRLTAGFPATFPEPSLIFFLWLVRKSPPLLLLLSRTFVLFLLIINSRVLMLNFYLLKLI